MVPVGRGAISKLPREVLVSVPNAQLRALLINAGDE